MSEGVRARSRTSAKSVSARSNSKKLKVHAPQARRKHRSHDTQQRRLSRAVRSLDEGHRPPLEACADSPENGTPSERTRHRADLDRFDAGHATSYPGGHLGPKRGAPAPTLAPPRRRKDPAFTSGNEEAAEGAQDRYGLPQLVRPRLGQGAFRVLVTDAYHRRCAMTGERTLPALEAAHIQRYSEQGPHRVDNGLLLRSDLHHLFDLGYLTVANDYRIEVSRRIKEEYENGRDYYALHGRPLAVIPSSAEDRPSRLFLDWHRSTLFRG